MKKYILNVILIIFLFGCTKQNKNVWTLYDIYPDATCGQRDNFKRAIDVISKIKQQGIESTHFQLTKDSIYFDTDNKQILDFHIYMEYAYSRKNSILNIEYGGINGDSSLSEDKGKYYSYFNILYEDSNNLLFKYYYLNLGTLNCLIWHFKK